MIISVSRRCDVPRYEKTWFLDIMEKGFVEVANPFNKNQIKKILLNKENIDLIVFWTKDAINFSDVFEYLNKKNIKFLVHYTINDYPKDIEPFTAELDKITDNFNFINSKYPDSVLWRYDPIILNENLDINYHINKFTSIYQKIFKSTKRCYTSFFDEYRKNKKFIKNYNILLNDHEKHDIILSEFNNIIENSDLKIILCSESFNIDKYNNIIKGACIDRNYLQEYYDLTISEKKDYGQRKNCNCIKSTDIGKYNSCKTGCKYCYACSNN